MMVFTSLRRFSIFGLALVALAVGVPACLAAEEAKSEAIYLDEPPAPPEAKVAREVDAPEKYEDGSIRLERHVLLLSDDRVVNNGKYTEYYRNGKKFAEGNFDNGVHDGDWTFWHDNGQVAKKVAFKKGKPDGAWEVFRADGTVLATRGYKDGKREGSWKQFYEDGKTPKVSQTFANGLLEGDRETYFPSGKVRQKSHFEKGNLNGLMIEWDETGRKLAEANFEDGKLNGEVVRWGEDGSKTEENYRNNERVGVVGERNDVGGTADPNAKDAKKGLRLLNN